MTWLGNALQSKIWEQFKYSKLAALRTDSETSYLFVTTPTPTPVCPSTLNNPHWGPHTKSWPWPFDPICAPQWVNNTVVNGLKFALKIIIEDSDFCSPPLTPPDCIRTTIGFVFKICKEWEYWRYLSASAIHYNANFKWHDAFVFPVIRDDDIKTSKPGNKSLRHHWFG